MFWLSHLMRLRSILTASERRIPGLLLRPLPHYVTVKTPELVAVPPGVVIAILPVFAPLGTLAVTCVSEFTTTVVALTPPNVTLLVWVRLTPLMVTGVPTDPLVGVKLLIVGVTRKFILLFKLPLGIATVTMPVLAPAGTVAVRKVSDEMLNVAA